MSTRGNPRHEDTTNQQDGLVADGQTSNDVARLLEAFHLPIGRIPITSEGHDRGRPGHGAGGSQSSAQHLRHRTHEAVAVVVLGPFDALQELEPEAQSGFSFEIFVQVRLREQKQSFAINTFCGEALDKRLRRAETLEKSSYLFAGPRVGVVGQPCRRVVEGAAPTPLLRRRRRRRDATRRAAGVSRAASAGHFVCCCCPRGAAAPSAAPLAGAPTWAPQTPSTRPARTYGLRTRTLQRFPRCC